MTTEQQTEFMQELGKFGQTLAKNFTVEDAVTTLKKLNELTESNPTMIRDISKFEGWGNLQTVAESIGSGIFKGKKDVTPMDIFKNFGKIKKQVQSALNQ